jgi:hypothetical protein
MEGTSPATSLKKSDSHDREEERNEVLTDEIGPVLAVPAAHLRSERVHGLRARKGSSAGCHPRGSGIPGAGGQGRSSHLILPAV